MLFNTWSWQSVKAILSQKIKKKETETFLHFQRVCLATSLWLFFDQFDSKQLCTIFFLVLFFWWCYWLQFILFKLRASLAAMHLYATRRLVSMTIGEISFLNYTVNIFSMELVCFFCSEMTTLLDLYILFQPVYKHLIRLKSLFHGSQMLVAFFHLFHRLWLIPE